MPMPTPRQGEDFVEKLRRTYQKNREIIGILAHWRNLFRISDQNIDRCLAYVFEKIRNQHGIRYKSIIDRLLHRVIQSPQMMQTIIAHLMLLHYSQDIDDEIRKLESSANLELSEDNYRRWQTLRQSQDTTIQNMQSYQHAIDNNREMEIQSIPDGYLPEWYFVSHAEFSLYNEEWVKPFLREIDLREKSLLEKEDETLSILKKSQYFVTPRLYELAIKPKYKALERHLKSKKRNMHIADANTLKALGSSEKALRRDIQVQRRILHGLEIFMERQRKQIPNKENYNLLKRAIAGYVQTLDKQINVLFDRR